MKTAPLFSITFKNFLTGLLFAFATPVLVAVQHAADSGTLTASWILANWKLLAMSGVGAGALYVIRKYLQPQQEISQLEPTIIEKVTTKTK